ncbi:hypothetical protein C8Q76DRAFT_804367 [Earliella scabrosa]|nr:hypothetical protein C8Q76DRAFT_804367 [Earliella scabrosa]
MSSPEDFGDLVAAYGVALTENYCWVATGVLLLYESVITVGSEVEYFWKPAFTTAAGLYFLNKYSAVAYYSMSLALYLPIFTDQKVTLHANRMTAFSTLRAFALSKNWYMSTIVLVFSVIPIVVNIWHDSVIHFIGYVDPIESCITTDGGTISQAVT